MTEKKGSLTIFAAISFMLVAELLFTLAEGTRYVQLQKIAGQNTVAAGNALLAEYCSPLWEKYQILGCMPSPSVGEAFSTEELEKEVLAITDMNFEVEKRAGLFAQYNLLRLGVSEAKIQDYELLTDDGGNCFVKQAASYMEKNLLYEETKFAFSEAQDLYNTFQATKAITQRGGFSLSAITDALRAIKSEANKPAPETNPSPAPGSSPSPGENSGEEETETKPSEAENILNKAKSCMEKGILLQVISDGAAKISSRNIEAAATVSHRSLEHGKGKASPSWTDRILLEQYLLSRMGCYTEKKGSGALDYELEYLLGGKDTDTANLKAVAEELLLIREACNLAYLEASTEKREALRAFAVTVSAAAANPLAGAAVRAGLMTVWAYAESLMDVRALLAGKKIPAIKSDATWTCTLDNMVRVFDSSMMAKESGSGIGYKSYLGILLFMKNTQACGMRTMDLEELAVRKEKGYENFKMDHLLSAASLQISYLYSPVFLGFAGLFKGGVPTEIEGSSRISYRQDG